MANLDTAIVNIAAPVIRTSRDASGAELQLIVSGYVVSYAALLITSARLGQMHGIARVFIVGATLFTLASLACGIAPNAPLLIGARLIQRVGAALMSLRCSAAFSSRSLAPSGSRQLARTPLRSPLALLDGKTSVAQAARS